MTSQDSGSFAAIITILASAETGPASADLPGEVLPVREVGTKADSGDSGGGHGELQREPGVPAGMGVIDTTGVIPSVVRTLIEEAGGRLDELYVSNIKSIYRICLPYASQISRSDLTPLKSVVKGSLRLKQWRILLAFSDARFAWLARTLTDLGAVVEKKTAIDKVLGAIDSERKPDVIIVDKTILDDDVGGLLKAMRKISPNSGVVVISHGPEEKTLQREQGFMVIDPDSGEDVWLDAIIRSRSFAV